METSTTSRSETRAAQNTISLARALPATLLIAALALPAARAAPPPTSVAPPKGINLGSTSFYDGFGRTDEGFTWLQYGRIEELDKISGPSGADNPLFKGTHIQALIEQTQISYASNWHPFGGDAVGIAALFPLVDFSSHFASDSPVKLANNGFGPGDLNIGPFYQSKYYMQDGRPVFAWRTQWSAYVPTGSVDTSKSINQGSGFWAFTPYVAFTWVPIPNFEVSSRINYQYNFQTSTLQSPPPIPGFVYHNGQAGQLLYGNYDASYTVLPNFDLGFNGYALMQLTPNKTNGVDVPHSLETEISLGPGVRYVFNPSNVLHVNLYLPVMDRNATSGTQVTFQYIHRF